MQRFRGGLVFKAHRLLYHSTLGLRVIKKKKKKGLGLCRWVVLLVRSSGCRGSGVRDLGSGFQVSGSEFRVSGVRVLDCGFRVSGFGFRVGCWASVFGFRVFGFWIPGSGFRVSGFEVRAAGVGLWVKGIRVSVHLLVRRALAASCCLEPLCQMEQVTSNLMFRGGLVFKAHRLLYHSTLGLRVIKIKKELDGNNNQVATATERALTGDRAALAASRRLEPLYQVRGLGIGVWG